MPTVYIILHVHTFNISKICFVEFFISLIVIILLVFNDARFSPSKY